MHKPSTATSSTIAHLEKQRRQRAKIPAYDPTVESKKTLLKRFFSIRRPNVTIDGRRIPIARESEAIVCDLDELRDLAQKVWDIISYALLLKKRSTYIRKQ